MKITSFVISTAILSALTLFVPSISNANPSRQADKIVSSTFQGSDVNAGTVSYTFLNGKNVLTLSDDFVVPKAPSPHWQVVDTDNNVFTLKRLDIKGGKFNRFVVLPKYIHNVSSVRIYCTFAEVLLGEAKSSAPVKSMFGGQN